MKSLIVLAHTVQKFPTDTSPVQAWFEAGLGAIPTSAQSAEEGEAIVILALVDAKAVQVQYPICVFPIGDGVEVPLNIIPGAFIGYVTLNSGTAAIFRGSPWPTTAIDAPAQGNA